MGVGVRVGVTDGVGVDVVVGVGVAAGVGVDVAVGVGVADGIGVDVGFTQLDSSSPHPPSVTAS